MKTYFENEILKHIKGVQHFQNNNDLWAQYDIKSLNATELSKVFNYFKEHYKEVYPRIQKFNGAFIGDIQIKKAVKS